MDQEILLKCIDELKRTETQITTVYTSLSLLNNPENVTAKYVDLVSELLTEILTKYGSIQTPSDYQRWLLKSFDLGKSKLVELASNHTLKEQRLSAFSGLINFLPLYHKTLFPKPRFPDVEYGEIVKVIVTSEGDIALLVKVLEKFITYEDMRKNLWKALDNATDLGRTLTPIEVKNVLFIIGLLKTSGKREIDERPIYHFCGVKIGVINEKQTSKCIRNLWERLIQVELPIRTKQLLLLTLLEKMISKIEKPLLLTDYFMNSLENGGAITLLSLQGIFELIQKHNINYPNIYGKLYQMFNPEIFDTSYKARFYYLADLFLSSTHLPEALVAGFVKRFARLCLVAPFADIQILFSFIINLLIRHPGLNKLVSNMAEKDFKKDPYLPDENDPSKSNALNSSLWEIVLLQNHISPNISSAALFINNPMPTVEKDLSTLLEVDFDDLFNKELKKKVKEPALAYERPTLTFLSKPKFKQAFGLWDFCK